MSIFNFKRFMSPPPPEIQKLRDEIKELKPNTYQKKLEQKKKKLLEEKEKRKLHDEIKELKIRTSHKKLEQKKKKLLIEINNEDEDKREAEKKEICKYMLGAILAYTLLMLFMFSTFFIIHKLRYHGCNGHDFVDDADNANALDHDHGDDDNGKYENDVTQKQLSCIINGEGSYTGYVDDKIVFIGDDDFELEKSHVFCVVNSDGNNNNPTEATEAPTKPPLSCDGGQFKFILWMDDSANYQKETDTAWKLVAHTSYNPINNIIIASVPKEEINKGQTYVYPRDDSNANKNYKNNNNDEYAVEYYCLPKNTWYTLSLTDTAGDGLNNGEGTYNGFLDGESVLYGDGVFESEISHEFYVGNTRGYTGNTRNPTEAPTKLSAVVSSGPTQKRVLREEIRVEAFQTGLIKDEMTEEEKAVSCQHFLDGQFHKNSAIVTLHNLSFGLVSAVVVSQIGSHQQQQQSQQKNRSINKLTHQLLHATTKRLLYNFITWTPRIYIVTWILTGCACLLCGALWGSDSSGPLYVTGQAWLGIAITTVYLFFGLQETAKEDNDTKKENDDVEEKGDDDEEEGTKSNDKRNDDDADDISLPQDVILQDDIPL